MSECHSFKKHQNFHWTWSLLCNNLPNFVFAEIILYNRSHVNSRALPNLKTAIANTCHSRFILEICTETRKIKTIQCEELFNKDHLNEKGPVHNWRYQFFLNLWPLPLLWKSEVYCWTAPKAWNCRIKIWLKLLVYATCEILWSFSHSVISTFSCVIKLVHVLLYDIFVHCFGMISI